MLSKIKQSLRITHDALDDEILELIEAEKIDLSISGVQVIEETDPLIIRAIVLYSKANFGLSNEDSEKYLRGYTSLKIHLSLCGEYHVNV